MANEKKLEKELEMYENLAKDNKKIDVASLMINAIKNQERNYVSFKQKKWAYLISVGLPPLGLLFALKFYFSDETDAKQVANICVLLTILSGLSLWLISKMIFSSSGVNLEQIQQINLNDIKNLTQ
jgi:hypothetical protein